jgi:hypothetical protein
MSLMAAAISDTQLSGRSPQRIRRRLRHAGNIWGTYMQKSSLLILMLSVALSGCGEDGPSALEISKATGHSNVSVLNCRQPTNSRLPKDIFDCKYKSSDDPNMTYEDILKKETSLQPAYWTVIRGPMMWELLRNFN